MTAAAPLAGLDVLLTRPAHQSAAWISLLQAAGARVCSLPLLAIAAPHDAEAARAALTAARSADFWIFTSANAVAAAASLQAEGWPRRLFALGQATAHALAARGHQALAEEGGRSEDLLARPELAVVQGQSALIVTGEAPRTLLATVLAERGARVAVAACYRRLRIVHQPGQVAAALARAAVVVLTSGEALDALLAETMPDQQALLLPSSRVAEAARRAGFQGPILLPAAVSAAAVITRLEQWQRAPHNDWP